VTQHSFGGSVPETTQDDIQGLAIDAVRPVDEEPLVEESLVEEVSIDGMCGVY
jgi:mycofactocin precursor